MVQTRGRLYFSVQFLHLPWTLGVTYHGASAIQGDSLYFLLSSVKSDYNLFDQARSSYGRMETVCQFQYLPNFSWLLSTNRSPIFINGTFVDSFSKEEARLNGP